MSVINIPFSQAPPHALVSLALYRGIDINWQAQELEFQGATDVDEIQRKLIDGAKGNEVRVLLTSVPIAHTSCSLLCQLRWARSSLQHRLSSSTRS
jgi:hypothetical protein